MGDLNEGAGPLAQRLAGQMRDAVLRDHIIHVVAAGGNGAALIQHGNDLGGPALDGGRHSHNRAAVLAHGRAADKVNLSAHTGDLLESDALRGHLSHQIHLHAGVDAYHVVVLRNDHRVIHMIHRVYLYLRVVIDKVIQPFGAHQEVGHTDAVMQRLAAVVDHAALHQIHHAVREHFRMDSQILLVPQERQHRVGNSADTQLQGVAIVDQRCAVVADSLLHRADFWRRQFQNGGGVFHEKVDVLHPHAAAAAGAGHLVVDLRDDQLCVFHSGQRIVHGNTQRADAVFVRRRHLYQRHIYRQRRLKQPGRTIEKCGGKVGPAVFHSLAGRRTDKQRVVVEVLRVFRPAVGAVAQHQHVIDLHIAIRRRVAHHGVCQAGGFAGGMAQHHPVAGFDMRNGFLCRGQS